MDDSGLDLGPEVMGEARRAGFPFAVALFIGNVDSIILLNCLVPFTSTRFAWWLNLDGSGGRRVGLTGVLLLLCPNAALRAVFMALFQRGRHAALAAAGDRNHMSKAPAGSADWRRGRPGVARARQSGYVTAAAGGAAEAKGKAECPRSPGS